ncbi:MAG: hypothetical protein ACJ796_03655 [Gemmatimonadaceae bacterium]
MTTFDLPKIIRSRKPLAIWATAFVAGLVAMVATFVITSPPGPGLDPDAASYLGAAEALAHGSGYRVPVSDWTSADSTSALTHFPPGYPTAMALPILLGAAPRQAARIVDGVAAFIEFAVVTWVVASVTGAITGLCLAAALLVMHPIAVIHLSVLSEPLYLACSLCALAAMVRLAESSSERHLAAALAAGIASASAMLVRYIGLSVCAAVALWIVIQHVPLVLKRRWSIAVSVPWIFLVGGWVAYVHLTSGVRSIRSMGAYGGFSETLAEGLSTVEAWLVPLSADQELTGRAWLALVFLVVLVALGILGARRARGSTAATAIAASGILAISYAVVLVVSRWLADPGIPFDERLLAPLFVFGAIILAIALHAWWRTARVPIRTVFGALLVTWFAASYHASSDEIDYAMEFGGDFGQEQWRTSPLLAWTRTNASGKILYSNWPPAIFFYLHRPAHELPNEADDAVLRAFADTIAARNAIVLLFDHPSPDQIDSTAILRLPSLRRIATVPDGSVFAPQR